MTQNENFHALYPIPYALFPRIALIPLAFFGILGYIIPTMTFAVITTGGKQYKVAVGDVLNVEKIEAEGAITFDNVLLVDDGSSTKIGTPSVAGAKVTADIVEQGKGPKLTVVKYHAKSRYYKKNGHRQPFTTIKITGIK